MPQKGLIKKWLLFPKGDQGAKGVSQENALIPSSSSGSQVGGENNYQKQGIRKQRFFHEEALEKWWGAVKHVFL